MKPATPLPWVYKYGNYQHYVNAGRLQAEGVAFMDGMSENRADDAAYIVHAANAYPLIIGLLMEQVKANPTRTESVQALLRELGELK